MSMRTSRFPHVAMTRRALFGIFFMVMNLFPLSAAQSRERPFILVEQEDRTPLLEKIEKYEEMKEAYTALKTSVDQQVASHKKNPAALLESIPEFGKGDRKHISILLTSVNCGLMYFLTGDEAYAQLSADVLNVYTQAIRSMEPDKISISMAEFFMDARGTRRQIGLTYDLISPFLKKPDTKVYDRTTKAYVAYRNEDTQEAIKRLAKHGLDHWAADSNHPLLEASGILYNILAIDDQADRDALVDIFVKGNRRSQGGPDAFFANRAESARAGSPQDKMGNGLLWARDTMLENGGHWPESPTYSGFYGPVLGWMDLVDKLYPKYKLFENSEPIFTAMLARKLFVYPNGTEAVAFGDSRRKSVGVGSFHTGTYQALIRIARRVGFKEIESNLMQLCKADLEKYMGSTHKYVPHVVTKASGVDYSPPLAFLSYDRVDAAQGRYQDFQTEEFKHAGVVIQKNVNVEDKEAYGLMCYAGGAHYVHCHLSGLDLELYGAGQVMGGVAADVSGPNERGSDLNRNYYRLYAGHNTVVVNGESRGGDKGSWKSDGMLYMDTTKTEAMEPASMTPAISKEFTFSSQRLDDTVNNCVQQRIVSIVRTGDKSGYYFDLFRSISKAENKYADYIYHNVGDDFRLTGPSGELMALSKQDKRYESRAVTGKNAWGKEYQLLFPGWHYFENANTSAPVAETIRGAFVLAGKDQTDNRYMHVAVPGGIAREYTSAEAPPILEVAKGYDKKKAKVFTIRQTGECWKRPFIVAYEPSTNEKSAIESIDTIADGDKVVGARIVSKIEDARVTDVIVAQDEAQRTYGDAASGLSFKGRFAIARTRESAAGTELTLYIGDGQELAYRGHVLKARDGKGYLSVKLDKPNR